MDPWEGSLFVTAAGRLKRGHRGLEKQKYRILQLRLGANYRLEATVAW